MLLKSGCICCTVRGEVAEALQNLHSLRDRGEIVFFAGGHRNHGTGRPYPVLQTLTAHPVLRSHYRNGGVLTTVDAVNLDLQFAPSGRGPAPDRRSRPDRSDQDRPDRSGQY